MKWVYTEHDRLPRWQFTSETDKWFATAYIYDRSIILGRTDTLDGLVFDTIEQAKQFVEYVYAYNKVTGEWSTLEQYDQHLLT